MQSTQLACPHCGSTLNFGTEIVTGSSVECLICMQSFTANRVPRPTPAVPSIDANDSPTLSDTITDVLPKVSAPAKAAPKSRPAPVGIMEKPTPRPTKSEPKKVDESTPLALRRPKQNAGAGTTSIVALIGGAALLLMVLTAGIGLAVWKAKSSTKGAGADDPPAIAAFDKPNNGIAKNDVKSIDDGKKTGGPSSTNPTPSSGGANKPPIKNISDDGDEKSLLQRKNQKSAGAEPDFDLRLGKFDVAKNTPVGLNQQRINEAIDKGVGYLRQTQKPDGTWADGHGVGHAAIGGLTLLECGVPANDFCVQRSAFYVRTNVLKLASTYELSLAILFLDRLGDIRDRPTIQGMGLRLLAGQKDSGGWNYSCPLLDTPEMYQLWAFLQTNRQPDLLNPLQGQINLPAGIVTDPKLVNPLTSDPAKLNDPFTALNAMMLTKGIDGGKNPNPGAGNPGGGTNPQNPPTPMPKPDPVPKKKGPPAKLPFQPVIQQAWLKPTLQNLPVVLNQGRGKGQQKVGREDGDNSNTQFAILALWAARRHGVPTEQGILAAYQRFVTSQNNDGGWGYHVNGGTAPSMTCVGLLGNGMGHGTAPDIVRLDTTNLKNSIVKPALDDVRIQNGLKALSKFVGQPSFDDKKTNFPMENLYFLWSVERVAMLYDLKAINGKDWYGWGAQILVHNQQPTGVWGVGGHYHGANPPLNTCFALLFLKRSNLVQDLTDNLRLYSGIRNPDAP
ncbi:MAG: hypothetical protein EXS16_06915 [Gemmataceae bacterium]|nr:hypothetical protein [Gemmataceae bacterium]